MFSFKQIDCKISWKYFYFVEKKQLLIFCPNYRIKIIERTKAFLHRHLIGWSGIKRLFLGLGISSLYLQPGKSVGSEGWRLKGLRNPIKFKFFGHLYASKVLILLSSVILIALPEINGGAKSLSQSRSNTHRIGVVKWSKASNLTSRPGA